MRFLVELHRVMLDIDLTRMQEALLAHCIRSTYQHCAAKGMVARERELVAFLRAFADHERAMRGSDDQTVRTLDALAGELSEFVEDGIYAHLWDRETNIPRRRPAPDLRQLGRRRADADPADVRDHGVGPRAGPAR